MEEGNLLFCRIWASLEKAPLSLSYPFTELEDLVAFSSDLCYSHQSSSVSYWKTIARVDDSFEVPALQVKLPKGKEQGGRSEERQFAY